MSAKKFFFQSAGLLAIASFIALNASFSLGSALSASSTKALDQNGVLQTIDSAVQQYRQTDRSDIVLLGSSLIMSPVWTADFHKYKQVGDFYRHHHSYLLEEKLQKTWGRAAKVFSFAVPGAMVSDMNLIVSKMLIGDKKPSLVVYGVAPRDFMDDLAGGETKTPTFQRLGEVSDLNRENFASSTIDEKLDLVFNRVFYLFGKRLRYQAKTDAFMRKIAKQAKQPSADQFMAVNNLNTCPLLQDKKILWQKSLDEYRMRYQRFNQQQFKKQEQFLKDMLTTCNKNDMQVLLVNMPLTQTNLSLMPEGLYEKYCTMLRSVVENSKSSKNSKIALLDLNEDLYSDDCFYDTVHLNEVGSEAFLSSLSRSIADLETDSSLASGSQKSL